MGFPGRGAPRGGGFRGGGGRGGGFRGGGRGGFRQDMGPPASVTELGTFTHPCEDQLVVKCSTERVPWFNAVVYLENKQEVGKVDEIFGGIRDHSVSVKLGDDMKASSFKEGQKLFIDPFKLFPLEKFTTPQRGGGRGGRGGRGGGRGGPRGGGRGGGFRGGGRGGPPGRGGGGFRGGGGGGGGFRGGGGGRGFGGPPNKRGRF